MSCTGIIQNGKVVLPPDVSLPEGSRVTVHAEPQPLCEGLPDWAAEIVKLAKPRNWPAGYARNLDDHLAAKPEG